MSPNVAETWLPPVVVPLYEASLYQALRLPEPLQPRSWIAQDAQGHEERLLEQPREAADFFKELERSTNTLLHAIFIGVGKDAVGLPRFVNAADAAFALRRARALSRGAELATYGEAELQKYPPKDAPFVVFLHCEGYREMAAPITELTLGPVLDVPELSLSGSQRFVIGPSLEELWREEADEEGDAYFELLIGCGGTAMPQTELSQKYGQGFRGRGILYASVHDWLRIAPLQHGTTIPSSGSNSLADREMDAMCRAIDEAQLSIFEALQQGNVGVFSVSDFERPLCIAALHYVWRHHVQRERNLPDDAADIQSRLLSLLPGLLPTYSGVIEAYRNWLLAQAADVLKADVHCPRGEGSKYSEVADLSMGPARKVLLCDTTTLSRVLPEERIFEALKLVLDCRGSTSSPMPNYRVGTCDSDHPPVLLRLGVHEWADKPDFEIHALLDEVQERIWNTLRKEGTVALHCNEDLHCSACIVACHFLWRFYALQHTALPESTESIYWRLHASWTSLSIRRTPNVYIGFVDSYRAHLKRHHGFPRLS